VGRRHPGPAKRNGRASCTRPSGGHITARGGMVSSIHASSAVPAQEHPTIHRLAVALWMPGQASRARHRIGNSR